MLWNEQFYFLRGIDTPRWAARGSKVALIAGRDFCHEESLQNWLNRHNFNKFETVSKFWICVLDWDKLQQSLTTED